MVGAAWVGSLHSHTMSQAGNLVCHMVVPGALAWVLTYALKGAARPLHQRALGVVEAPETVTVSTVSLALASVWEVYELGAQRFLVHSGIVTDLWDTTRDVASGVTGGALLAVTLAATGMHDRGRNVLLTHVP